MEKHIITLEKISKVYTSKREKITALNNINLNIERGSFVLIKGRSGSGKTTLLNLISALDKPTTGKIVVDNIDITKLSDPFSAEYRRKKIGFIFQQFHLLEDITVFENVLLSMIPTKNDFQYIKNTILEVSKRFDMEKFLETPAWKLSGGQKQRVTIMRALANDPPIILADEPTSNLDNNLSKELMNILQELNRNGKTILIVSHDEIIFRYPFSISYVLEDGQLNVHIP
ncbi:MAG: ABC transporter ATP-binding protein [Calditerrivibrio sp.]|nr:ABC transporter ATP-binding protein [Calditerrivibrio sp.]